MKADVMSSLSTFVYIRSSRSTDSLPVWVSLIKLENIRMMKAKITTMKTCETILSSDICFLKTTGRSKSPARRIPACLLQANYVQIGLSVNSTFISWAVLSLVDSSSIS